MAVIDAHGSARSAALAAQLRPEALRPILTSLNGDNSWLMSFPRPPEEAQTTGKAYFHMVFEPWLVGATSVLSSWLVYISLTQPAAVDGVAAIEAVIGDIEDAAAGGVGGERIEGRGVDAILLGFHYSDHVHEATLRAFDGATPVVATPEAAGVIQAWGHFSDVSLIHDLPASATTWQGAQLHPGGGLPSWLTALRLRGHAELNFSLAIVWTHAGAHEALLTSPHGTRLDGGPLQAFIDATPPTRKLALLHGLKESHTLGYQTTLGASGGLALYRRMGGADYWIPSHHSTLRYAGVLMRLLRTVDTPRSLPWALAEERRGGRRRGSGTGADEAEGGRDEPRIVHVDNGARFVLQ